MDLPVCPSCGQSVLDENPELCPFCGSSMKAKPGQKPPAAPKSSSSKPAPAKSAAGGPAAKSAPAEKPAPGSDDPFAFKTELQDTSIRVALKPAKGRTYKVTCPMCETTGFVPESAAGKQVRCANPGCMVPVFEAPSIKKEEAPPPPPKKSISPIALITGIGLVGVIGFNVWYFVLRTPEELPTVDYRPVNDGNVPNNNNPVTPDPVNGESKPPENGIGEVRPKVDPIAFRNRILDERMLDIAQSNDWNSQRNRSLTFCRQVLVECYARLGLLDKAAEQMPFIDRGNASFSHERLPPLVEIAWQKLTAGADAQPTLTEAIEAAKKTASAGRARFDRFNSLAAVLFAAGQTQEARDWSRRSWQDANISNEEQLIRTRMASSHLRIYRDLPSYTFPVDLEDPLGEWEVPEDVTVTMLLAGHDRADAVRDWSKAVENPRAQSDCLAAWARWGLTTGRITLADVESQLGGLPPVTRVRVLSIAASIVRGRRESTEADRLLQLATAGVPAARAEYRFPTPSQLVGQTPAVDSAALHDVLALAALADAQHRSGDDAAAWATLQTALATARGLGPSPIALASQPRRAEDPTAQKVMDQLKTGLNLANDNAVRIQFNNFTSRLSDLQVLSDLRMALVQELLGQGVDWGLTQEVWSHMRERIDAPDNNVKEPLLQSPLLARVHADLTAKTQTEAVAEITLRMGQKPFAVDRFEQFLASVDGMIASGDFKSLKELVQRSGIERNRMQVALVPRVVQLAADRKYRRAADLLDSLPDQILVRDRQGRNVPLDLITIREELYFFLGREAGRQGDGPQIEELVAEILPTATEESILWGGVVLGMQGTAPPKTSPAEPVSQK